jgi:hypothetical protein
MLAGIKNGKGFRAVYVNEELPVDARHNFDVASIVCLILTQVLWILCHYLTKRFTFILFYAPVQSSML